MNYENVLLIGGPRDGQRMSVLAGIPSLRVGQLPAALATYRNNAVPTETVAYGDVIYHRHPMQTSRGLNTAVYVCGDIDPLAALIDGYRPAK